MTIPQADPAAHKAPSDPRGKIGLALHDGGGVFESVRQIAADVRKALGQRYDLLHFEAASLLDKNSRSNAAERIVEECDAIVGFGKTLFPLLQARHELKRNIPCIIITLGAFGRGALPLKALLPLLTSNDILVVSCVADEGIARSFFPTLRVILTPFSVNAELFYPADATERSFFRKEHGLTPSSQLIFYAGRITLEKNLHTALRVFASLLPHLSDPYFFLAGPFLDLPFNELGTVPVAYSKSLAKAIDKLGIPVNRVAHLGVLSQDQLRVAYSSADVMMNLTLHHDENFGLGQIEALACGTPVVGAGWGGLHDTIQTGANGHKVRVTPTPHGVKLDWWDAANAIYDFLIPPSGTRAPLHRNDALLEQYSFDAFANGLVRAIECGIEGVGLAALPVAPSEFAAEFWRECSDAGRPYCRYAYGTRSFELYQELVSFYTGPRPKMAQFDSLGATDTVLILPVPLTFAGDDSLEVSDPLFPTEVPVPPNIQEVVTKLVDIFTRKPVRSFEQLETSFPLSDKVLQTALKWMIGQGLLLLSDRHGARMSDENFDAGISAPLFAMQTLDGATVDFVVMRNWTSM